MIWSWEIKRKWCTKRRHHLTENPEVERGRPQTQVDCSREQSLFFIHCCTLNVRSIIKCGSIKYWKMKLNWRGKVLTLERNILGTPPTKQKQEGRRHDEDTEQTPPPNFLQPLCSEKKGIRQKAKCHPDQGIALVCQVVLFQISQIYPFLMVSRWQQPHP